MPKVKIRCLQQAHLNHRPQSKRSLAGTRRRTGVAGFKYGTVDGAELQALVGQRDYHEFSNPRNELYRLLAKESILIRRPVVTRRLQMALGFEEEA